MKTMLEVLYVYRPEPYDDCRCVQRTRIGFFAKEGVARDVALGMAADEVNAVKVYESAAEFLADNPENCSSLREFVTADVRRAVALAKLTDEDKKALGLEE